MLGFSLFQVEVQFEAICFLILHQTLEDVSQLMNSKVQIVTWYGKIPGLTIAFAIESVYDFLPLFDQKKKEEYLYSYW